MGMRLSYANVASTLALIVALGGTSYAAIKLPRDSVGSKQVRDGSLKALDLAPGARRTRTVIATPKTQGGAICEGGCEGPFTISASAQCPPGMSAVGGGVSAEDFADGVVVASAPIGSPGSPGTGWLGTVRYTAHGGMGQPPVYVICAS